ncbi:MAG: hypothetical protein RR710_09370 [Oscillospiraceae bacterium]
MGKQPYEYDKRGELEMGQTIGLRDVENNMFLKVIEEINETICIVSID